MTTVANSVIKGTKVNIFLNGVARQRIKGSTVCVNISGSVQAPNNSNTVLFNLAEARPLITVYGILAVEGGTENKYALGVIQNNGDVIAMNYSGKNANYLFGTIVYNI